MLVWVLVGVSLADLSGFPWKQTLRQGVDFSRFIEKWESETGKGREVKLRKKKKKKTDRRIRMWQNKKSLLWTAGA